MRRAIAVLLVLSACGGAAPATAPAPVGTLGQTGKCENYAEVVTVPPDRSAMLEALRAAARNGDRAAVARAIDAEAAAKISLALGNDPAHPEEPLTALLAGVPQGCAARWVSQDLRIDIQPPFDDTPTEQQTRIEAGIQVLGRTQQFVLTCGDCGELAIALVGEKVVAWGAIP